MAKKDDQDICAHLLWFSTNFSEILSISVFFRGCLNGAFKSDLTIPHSAHFFKVENWFLVCWIEFQFRKHSYTLFFDTQGAHSAHYAILTALKKDTFAKNFRKIGWKTKKMCANIPIGFFVHCPFYDCLLPLFNWV